MSDVHCPYCKCEIEIIHDDGQGYEDDNEQDCLSCLKTFKFTTNISYHYDVYCVGGHDMKQNKPPHAQLWECTRCEYYEGRD